MAKRIIFRCSLPNGDVETIMEQPNHTVEALKVGAGLGGGRGAREDLRSRVRVHEWRAVGRGAARCSGFLGDAVSGRSDGRAGTH